MFPLACGLAVVLMRPTSVPAWASVSAIEPLHSPLTKRAGIALLTQDFRNCPRIVAALSPHPQYMSNAWLEAPKNSRTAVVTIFGRFCPPCASGTPSPVHPASR